MKQQLVNRIFSKMYRLKIWSRYTQWIINIIYQSYGLCVLLYSSASIVHSFLFDEEIRDLEVMNFSWYSGPWFYPECNTFTCFQRFSFIQTIHFLIIFYFGWISGFHSCLIFWWWVCAVLFIAVRVSAFFKNQ